MSLRHQGRPEILRVGPENDILEILDNISKLDRWSKSTMKLMINIDDDNVKVLSSLSESILPTLKLASHKNIVMRMLRKRMIFYAYKIQKQIRIHVNVFSLFGWNC